MNEVPTRYGLDGPAIESRWRTRFFAQVQTVFWAHPTSYKMGTGSFPGVKRPGCGVDHPLPPNAKVKERVELYLYFPSGPSWAVLGWTLPLPFTVSEHCPGRIKLLSRTPDPSQYHDVWLNLGVGGDRCLGADTMMQPIHVTACMCFWRRTWVALIMTGFP
jgi:hypothetical protein